MTASSCLHADSLARYCDGQAREHEAAAIRAHAAACPSCSMLLRDLSVHAPGVEARALRPSASPEAELQVDGRYRLEQVIGMGGMGTVHSAVRLADGVRVAIKTLHAGVAADSVACQRLRREARILASISNPHAVRMLDWGELPTGAPFLVMELLEGTDLQSLVQNRGPLEADIVVQVLLDACSALGEAHARGIVHRDVKPHNLFFARGGDSTVLKVLDFGLGTARESLQGALHTREGMLLGTPGYMPPEQVRNPAAVDARSDIYSLGATAYQLLSGAAPFTGAHTALVLAHVLSSNATPLVSLAPRTPPTLIALIERCMQKEPALRPQSCADLVQALRSVSQPAPGRRTRWPEVLVTVAFGAACGAVVAQLLP